MIIFTNEFAYVTLQKLIDICMQKRQNFQRSQYSFSKTSIQTKQQELASIFCHYKSFNLFAPLVKIIT